jgi:CNT family concentrative nucleoside transporter
VAAKILVPETETFNQEMHISRESNGDHWLDALSRGTSDGLKLAVNVGAMLLVFTAFIYLVNSILADGIGAYTGLNAWMADFSGGRYTSFNLQAILGLSLAPLTWLMGVNWTDAALVGQLLGEKTILNEFYAYVTLGNLIETGALVETKSQVMATYILCGFANFASIGIQIGGIGTLAPHRRADLSRLGVKALVGGTVASLFTAVLVGLFY